MINIMEKRLPVLCPSCDSQLRVSSMLCEHCDTTVTGFFQLPVLMRLAAVSDAISESSG